MGNRLLLSLLQAVSFDNPSGGGQTVQLQRLGALTSLLPQYMAQTRALIIKPLVLPIYRAGHRGHGDTKLWIYRQFWFTVVQLLLLTVWPKGSATFRSMGVLNQGTDHQAPGCTYTHWMCSDYGGTKV